jgi:hypothetical protein
MFWQFILNINVNTFNIDKSTNLYQLFILDDQTDVKKSKTTTKKKTPKKRKWMVNWLCEKNNTIFLSYLLKEISGLVACEGLLHEHL